MTAPESRDATSGTDTTAPPVVSEDGGHPQRWLILVVVLFGQFMVVSAMGTVNITLPDIKQDLGASDSAIQWVLVLYQLGYAVVLVTGGRLGDIHGRKRLFLIGMSGFVAASAVATVAPTIEVLMAARLVQGISGGLTSPQILAVISVAFPQAERPRAFAAFGMVAGSAFMVGQVMSGILMDLDPADIGWRAPFVVNVVIGAVSVVVAARILPETTHGRQRRLDLAGVVLVSLGGLLLLYPLIQGRADGWPPVYFVMLGLALPVFLLFLRLERRLTDSGSEPLVDLHLFRTRSFRSGLIVAVAFTFGTFPMFYVLTLTLQLGFGYDPLEAALATLASPIALVTVSSLSARLLPRFGRTVMGVAAILGMLFTITMIITLELVQMPPSPLQLVPALILLGSGNGLGMTALINLTLADVTDENAGSASGLFQTVQQATTALGVAVAGMIYFGTIGDDPSIDDYVRGYQTTLVVALCTSALVFALHFLLPPRSGTAVPVADSTEDDLVQIAIAPST